MFRVHVWPSVFRYEQDRVACVDCRHFIPDSMGGGGIGECRIGHGEKQSSCLYPYRERACSGFSSIAQGDDIIHVQNDTHPLIDDTINHDVQDYEAWASSVPCTEDDDVSNCLILSDEVAYDDTSFKGDSSESAVHKGQSIDPALVGIAYVRKPVKKHELPRF